MQRRAFLLAAPAVLTLARTLPAWAADTGADPFSGGVASGDPDPTGFVLWTRLQPTPLAFDGLGGMRAPAPVRWEVAADEGMRQIVASGRATATEAMGYSVHVEVSGLKPGRPYWYRFTAMGFQSPIGRAVTAPAHTAMPDQLKFGFVSCSHYEVGWFSAYRHLAAEQPDLTFFLGDYIYEYSYGPGRKDGIVRPHGVKEAATLAHYRQRYAQYRTDPDLQALHRASPCVATWDDHEVQNDYGGDVSQIVSTTPEQMRARRIAAYRAFYEAMPLRKARYDRGRLEINRKVRYGALAEFYVLDTRQHRSPMACMSATSRRAKVIACDERLDPRRSMLGMRQERWLYDQFAKADTRWNFVTQSLIAASFKQRAPDESLASWSDAWDGYPANRDRMIQAMDRTRLSNPVVLSGDIHSFWANQVAADPNQPTGRSVASEFVCTSITADNPPAQPFASVRADNPNVRFFERQCHGYASAVLSSKRMDVRFQTISDRLDPNATLSTLFAASVETGSTQIQI